MLDWLSHYKWLTTIERTYLIVSRHNLKADAKGQPNGYAIEGVALDALVTKAQYYLKNDPNFSLLIISWKNVSLSPIRKNVIAMWLIEVLTFKSYNGTSTLIESMDR